MTAPRASEPLLFLRQDAVREGWSDDEIARLARAGQLQRLRRGAYVDGPLPDDAAARHVMLGLPLWGVALDRVHVTRRPRPGPIAAASWSCTSPDCATTRSPRWTASP